jgi:hypothetical protein
MRLKEVIVKHMVSHSSLQETCRENHAAEDEERRILAHLANYATDKESRATTTNAV